MNAMTLEEKVTGCLLGVAVGDALGAPFELLKPGPNDPRLRKTGGEIFDYHPFLSYPPGSWTDDTGMTLAVCRGLTRHLRTGRSLDNCLRRAFRAWVDSDECRQPGKTVYLSAKYGKTDENSWASGALMRSAPVAVFALQKALSTRKTAELAFRTARLTHGHPLAVLPAVEFTLALQSILLGKKKVPPRLMDYDLLAGLAERRVVEDYLRLRRLPASNLDPTTGLFLWKQVLEDLLAVSEGVSWSSLPRFDEGILRVVNKSADRDTAGAVAGALLGARWGMKGIPRRWKNRVEKSQTIVLLARDLIRAAGS